MKPIDLIVVNFTHAIASAMTMAPLEASAMLLDPEKRDEAMRSALRQMLCNVAHDASDAMVAKALAAVGAPTSADELHQRITAAGEAQRREAMQ